MSENLTRRHKEIQEQHQNDVPPAPPPATAMHALKKYTAAMMQLRTLAEQLHNVRPFYFDNYVLVQYFQQQCSNSSNGSSNSSSNGSNSNNNEHQNDPSTNTFNTSSASMTFIRIELMRQIRDRRRQILFYLMLLFLFFIAFPAHEVAVERGMHFVYPGMRIWRRITLPLIERFPRLTELYDETCLMGNPFFQVEDLSCDSCTRVQTVLDHSRHRQPDDYDDAERDAEKRSTDELVPFIFKINQTPIQLDDFYKVYIDNYKIFQRDAYRVQSSSNKISNLHDLFSQFNLTVDDRSEHSQKSSSSSSTANTTPPPTTSQPQSSNSHNLWRCNRMLPARLLRQLFVRPDVHLPETGIALERYVAIDTPAAASYTLPETECANVFIQQALGTRFIILRPTSECRHKCRTLSIRLPQSFVLSYNWWYWKPISAPDPLADTLSISLIGSYC